MAILNPVGDMVLGGMGIVGSPAIGYVVLRTVLSSSAFWEGWKRMLASIIIGIGWSSVLLGIISPLGQQPVSILQLMEIGFTAGMGGILIVGMTAIGTRIPHYLMRRQTTEGTIAPNPTQTKNNFLPKKETTKTIPPKISESTRAQQKTIVYPPKEMEKPILENDIMDLLKENQSYQGKKEEEIPSPIEEGLEETAEELGFEDTIAQLKRDLKEFNESVGMENKKRR